jgi:hypothetical protein
MARLTAVTDARIRTYNELEYFVGSGATTDLLILIINACISYSKKLKDN